MEQLESWLRSLRDPDAQQRIAAVLAIEDWAFEAWKSNPAALERLKAEIPLFLAGLNDPERRVRLRCVRILGALGPFEADAIAAVVALFHREAKGDEVLRDDVLTTLGSMGPNALPFLQQLWKTKGIGVSARRRILSAAGYIGPEALPFILEGFGKKRSDYWETVKEVISLMESRGPCDPVPALREAMNRPEALLSVNAAGSLIRRAPQHTREAIGHIRKALLHSDKEIRDAALSALREACGGELSVLEPERFVVPEGVEDAMPELLTLLHDQEQDIRQWALVVITRLGPRASQAVPLLADIIQNDPTDVYGVPFSKMAAEALAAIGPAAAAAVPALVQMLEDDRPTMPTGIPNSLFAALALGNIGPAARSAVPALQRLLQRTHPQLRHNVSGALEQIQGPTQGGSWWSKLIRRWRGGGSAN